MPPAPPPLPLPLPLPLGPPPLHQRQLPPPPALLLPPPLPPHLPLPPKPRSVTMSRHPEATAANSRRVRGGVASGAACCTSVGISWPSQRNSLLASPTRTPVVSTLPSLPAMICHVPFAFCLQTGASATNPGSPLPATAPRPAAAAVPAPPPPPPLPLAAPMSRPPRATPASGRRSGASVSRASLKTMATARPPAGSAAAVVATSPRSRHTAGSPSTAAASCCWGRGRHDLRSYLQYLS